MRRMKNRVIIVRTSSVTYDPRIDKEARALAKAGYDVGVLGWDRDDEHKKKERTIGITTKVKCTKNKIGLPFRECFLDILFDYGVDNLVSNLKFLYDLYTPTGKLKTKTQFDWIDDENAVVESFVGLSRLIKYIEDNNLEDVVSYKTKQKWYQIEKEISSEDRKRPW